MRDRDQERRWFWATLILSSISIVAVVFAFWELVENHFFRELNYVSLHYLYISRGIASSLLLATWAAWFVLRQRRRAEEELRRQRERYRGLLEASPGAVALYDRSRRVVEWNATAERLYGFAKQEVIGHDLPTVPADKEDELEQFLRQVEGGDTVLDWETVRRNQQGQPIAVQLSLLPFREAGRSYFLEVTDDIRERVRLRQTLLELEKLTTMGKMAAGTAHHLNTPMASMLLRVQMMRRRAGDNGLARDLEQLENTIGFCQQFVRRLLEFSRRPAPQKRPEEIGGLVEAVVGFLAPSIHAKQAKIALELQAAAGHRILADTSQLETLLLILLSNALDAIPSGGAVTVCCRRSRPDFLDVEIADNGSGVSPQDLPYIFEPFFTTKPPGKGTGLGLAIAKNIVAEHGGAIRLENAAAGGAVACVQLPIYREIGVRQEAAP